MPANARAARYPVVDIVKLLMALFVVEIHTRPFRSYQILERFVEGIDCIAVPFFFIVSGFFCFRVMSKEDCRDSFSKGIVRIQKFAFKLLRLYLIWTVIFLPVTVFGSILNKDGLLGALLLFVRGTVFVGENYYSWPLWYLLAGAIGFGLIYLFLRGGVSPKRTLAAAFGCLIIGFLITFIQGLDSAPVFIALPVKLYTLIFGSSRNGLFVGFFYISVGMIFGLYSVKLSAIPLKLEFFCFVFGVVGSVVLSNDVHLPFCALSSCSLTLIVLRKQGDESGNFLMARGSSTVIYLVHMFFVVLFVYGICGCNNPELLQNNVNGPLLYSFALACSFIVALVVIPLSRKHPIVKVLFGL